MKLTGENYIGSARSAKGSSFQAMNPATGAALPELFFEATESEIDEAAVKASATFRHYRNMSGASKAEFLEAIASALLELGDDLIRRCAEETGLPETRLIGERGRTMGQLRLFASMLRDGWWVDARIDHADPIRTPLPKPDVRSMQRPIGPVAVFGASNFPLAFSVAGGDTASALAAGCPVIFKAHHAHPGTCELVASAIIRAAQATKMPDGVFSMVHGKSNSVGGALVKHPLIKAIGFTGSFFGGKAIFDEAAKRPEPIPVYAEMGSVNPVFILPQAVKERGAQIAKDLAASVTQGVGQFCTNPGLVMIERSEPAAGFESSLQEHFKQSSSGVMLSDAIHGNFQKGIEKLKRLEGVSLLASGKNTGTGAQGTPTVFSTTATKFISEHVIEEEVFGPSTVLVQASSREEILKAAQRLSGHLTATILGTEAELRDYADLIEILEQKVGRVIINGYPTGVEVCHSMVHGGPFPSTTDSRSTSVGTRAILRFTRPVCYQGFPESLLPPELQDANPLGITRLVDGKIET